METWKDFATVTMTSVPNTQNTSYTKRPDSRITPLRNEPASTQLKLHSSSDHVERSGPDKTSTREHTHLACTFL